LVSAELECTYPEIQRPVDDGVGSRPHLPGFFPEESEIRPDLVGSGAFGLELGRQVERFFPFVEWFFPFMEWIGPFGKWIDPFAEWGDSIDDWFFPFDEWADPF
jgi:hypothetical protein